MHFKASKRNSGEPADLSQLCDRRRMQKRAIVNRPVRSQRARVYRGRSDIFVVIH